MKKQKPLVRVTVRLSSKELEFVKKTAKKDKVSLSQAVRDLIAYGMY
jgi:predicted DNA binding CopG/RHH family protein